ncbi:hypothetical protein C7C56_001295 [Massilia glaciei]|uniref:Uncharacterized protein n=2 Tax=Massilia glaciei TaxID=1524097 RepID=A0A2U2I788_9BURK|nr:hypothetical protein C7C56_001295 [Massilia glaciei]
MTVFLLSLALLSALFVMFQPLLTGLGRAFMLMLNPRLSKEELAARAHMRDAEMLQRMINAAGDASQASELRALGARY